MLDALKCVFFHFHISLCSNRPVPQLNFVTDKDVYTLFLENAETLHVSSHCDFFNVQFFSVFHHLPFEFQYENDTFDYNGFMIGFF